MQVKKEQLEPTKVKLTVTADAAELEPIKGQTLKELSADIKVQGFRPGKAPAKLVEKQIDQSQLQAAFLDAALNEFYVSAIREQNLRPIAPPQVNVTKFVPFTTLEFTAEVEVVGDIKLADYKKIKLPPAAVSVTAKDVDEIIQNLRRRAADKKSVQRPAKNGDELTIDFQGVDAKTQESIAGADGKDYALLLGGKTFIPGFEEALIGLKNGAKKTFKLTFPKDYGAKHLQNRAVSFTVNVKDVQELGEPKLDDTFAASIGPFKTVAELKADIKTQLTVEKQREAQGKFDNELLDKIAAASTVAIPQSLINEEIDRLEEEEKRNLVYRGQTWQEHLDAEGLTAEAHLEQKRPAAGARIKAGLVLSEIAEREAIKVSDDELNAQLAELKKRYASDERMQAELDKSENRRDIASRLMAEKTLAHLRTLAAKT